MLTLFCCLFLLLAVSTHAVDFNLLQQSLNKSSTPFNYPLNINIQSGHTANEDVILCCHGTASDSSLANVIASYRIVNEHIIGFNFPDYGKRTSSGTSGTIQELLPAFYMLKLICIDANVPKVSLYGFSSGGGAVINLIAVLNQNVYDGELSKLGINLAEKERIRKAIQNGVVLLDAPVKTLEEILETIGYHPHTAMKAQRYRNNDMRPFDSLLKWQGLNLSVVLFFQNPDESLANRDDKLFINRLYQVNTQGQNIAIVANEGGHCGFHRSLWNAFNKINSKRTTE